MSAASAMTTLPANLPSIANAKIPATYRAATESIAECARIDECKDWADKSEALASYAKQAGNDELRQMADRIQARAIRRCGELLREIPKANGVNQNISGDAPTKVTRTSAAIDAGLSRDQRVTALRVANVPAEEFEKAVESPAPPTVTALAERGKQTAKPATDHLQGKSPSDYRHSTQVQGNMAEFAKFLDKSSVEMSVRGAFPPELRRMSTDAAAISQWLEGLKSCIERELERTDGSNAN